MDGRVRCEEEEITMVDAAVARSESGWLSLGFWFKTETWMRISHGDAYH